jgi:hypothetical protein
MTNYPNTLFLDWSIKREAKLGETNDVKIPVQGEGKLPDVIQIQPVPTQLPWSLPAQPGGALKFLHGFYQG